MLIQIKRQECLNKFPKFPTRVLDEVLDDFIEYYPESYSYYTLTTGHKTFKGRMSHLGKEISRISKWIGCNNLIFLGNEDIPWLYRDSDYKPAKAALDYLAENKVGKEFNGGLHFDISQIPVFVKHLGWLTRCNTVLPYVHFTDPAHNIIGHICQYGNLHLSILNLKTDKVIKPHFENSKLELLTDKFCT